MITAIVHGDLRKRQMIELSVDGHHVVTTWGKARVQYTRTQSPASKYMVNINGCETFFHVDAIEVLKKGRY